MSDQTPTDKPTSSTPAPRRQRPRFTLIIEDIAPPDDAPVHIRLRGVLKRLLRDWNFRALSHVATPDEQKGETTV